jgi:hypothetical protein
VDVAICGVDRCLLAPKWKFFPHILLALEKSPLFRDLWQREYFHLANKEDHTKLKDAFEVQQNRIRTQGESGNEFSLYRLRGAGIATVDSKPISWQDILGQRFPSIRQWAFDILTCPSESLAVQNDFSPDLNALSDDIIEALKVPKSVIG